MKTPVTMQNIADRLGLSNWTVSMSLRGNGKVAKATRAKVRAAARKMGYRPNLAAATLASLRFKTPIRAAGLPIAFIDVLPGQIWRNHHVTIFEMAKPRAVKLGYEMHHYQVFSLKELKPLLRTLYFRGFAGIILGHVIQPGVELRTAADWSPFAVVGVGAYTFPIPFHRVKTHYFNSIKMAWAKATERGYWRLGAAIFQHSPPVNDDYLRLGAALAMQQETARPRDRVPPLLCDHQDKAAFLKWFHRHRPDAVISFHLAAHTWLERDGVRIPEKAGFVSLMLDHTAWGYKICSVWQKEDAMINEAINLLDQRIRHGDCGVPEFPLSIMVESSWHEGQSLPPREVS